MSTATGAENLESLMKAELSAEIFAGSSVSGCLTDDETAVTPKKHRMSRKTGPPSSTKEQADNAISTAAFTAKDDYI